jgi:hypothetical protein
MCSGNDALNFVMPGVGLATSVLMPKTPQMPDVVRTDPMADKAKADTDAAQQAQNARLLQRRSARRNSLLSNAGAVGDPSTATVSTPTVTGKPNLGS